MATPLLPEAEINALVSAINRANAAMKKFYEASGVPAHQTINHFSIVEMGFPYHKEKIRRGGRFVVETRPSTAVVETRTSNTRRHC